MRTRLKLRPERIEPTGSWLARLFCILVMHDLGPDAEHGIYIYDCDERLAGLLCHRCGKLLGWT